MADDETAKRIYTLKERANQLRLHLQTLEDEAGDARSEHGQVELIKAQKKEVVMKQLLAAVQTEKDAAAGKRIVVKFPKQGSLDNGFSIELAGDGITWAMIRDRACVMFGRSPEETMVVKLVRGHQRILTPLWAELKPGEMVEAELITKMVPPPVVRALRSREPSSSQTLSRRRSSSAAQASSNGALQFSDEPKPSQASAQRKELVMDLVLHVCLFIVLAVGLIDPSNLEKSVRYFNYMLQEPGQAIFSTTRSGSSVRLAFDQNITFIGEALDWVRGPMSTFLQASNTTSMISPVGISNNPRWWGATPPSLCPATVSDLAPLCTDYNFSVASFNKSSWLTAPLSTEVIGAVRLRQFRVRPNSCRSSGSQRPCFDVYSSESRSTQDYGPRTCGFRWFTSQELNVDRPGAPTIQGSLATYDSSGFVLDIATPDQWRPALQFLGQNGWVDEATRAIMVELTVRNPNDNLFASLRALVEKDKTGAVRTRWDVKAFRIPMDGEPPVRLICNILAFFIVLIIFVRALKGGFFFKMRNRLSRTYDMIFSVVFLGSFIVDMILLSNYNQWLDDFSPSTTMYRSSDSAFAYVEMANRYRAGIVVLVTMKFLFQGTFSFSQMTTDVLGTLVGIYFIVLIILVPFMCSLVWLVMVLEQGSPNIVVSFGSAFLDVLLIVTGVTDRLTGSTPRIGRHTGWSTVFYLILITFTWVLVVPTLIGFAVIAYEHEAAIVATSRSQPSSPGISSQLTPLDKSLSLKLTSSPPPSPNMRGGNSSDRERLEYSPLQVLLQSILSGARNFLAAVGARMPRVRGRPDSESGSALKL